MAAAPKSNTGPFGIPPGGPWFADALTGTIQRQSDPVLAEALAESGQFVGFATQAEAKAFLAQSIPAQVKKPIGAAVGAAESVGDFLGKLGERNTWLRVLKVVIGVVLVIVGLVQLTHADKLIGPAAKAAVLA
jgi:hypothetical protein